MSSSKVKLRFAPSPTGHFHLGHVVSLAFVFGVAEFINAEVLLRIEDHDRERCKEEYVQSILNDMEWLGFIPHNWNAVHSRGKESAYRQSYRLDRYQTALKQLKAAGVVYYCDCSRQEITSRTFSVHSPELIYDGRCRKRGLTTGSLRMVIPECGLSFYDLWHGHCVQRPAEQCGDLLLVDRHGNFTYNFCVVVDDIHEDIHLIVRGDDILTCTGRQLILAKALGSAKERKYLHHPLIFDEKGKKLSKRFYSTSLAPLRMQGITPDDILSLALQQAKLLSEGQKISRQALGQWTEKLLRSRDNGT